ncbi:MAG: undecaprenyl-diphosphate phosphatase [Patescibacteria group bacterium]
MVEFWQAIILGAVEGITEFLPISSTGHLILTSRILGLNQTEFLKTFEIAIQLGAILAVLWLYRVRFLSRTSPSGVQTPDGLVAKELFKKVFVAFLPTALVGFALYKLIKNVLFERIDVIVWALLIGGALMILAELVLRHHTEEDRGIEDISYRQAFLIGVCQSFAVIPGISRAAATILGGLALGVPRRAIVEFSFLLAVPTMLAATGLDLLKSSPTFSAAEAGILVLGFFVSFVTALLSIRWLMQFIERHTFIPFGVYRILAGIAFLFLLARGV